MSISAMTPLSLLVAVARPDGIILSRDARAVGLERELRTEIEHGHLVQLRWGAYTLAFEWSLLKPEKRYLLRVRALAAMSEAPVIFSHHSAAAIWDLPVVGRWPAGIEVLTATASGGRSKGFLVPELQVRFDDEAGFIAFVDFFWRKISKIGEFDGFGKYVKEEFTKGRTTVEVIMDEKRREDRVRGCGPTVSRWDWDMLKVPSAFGRFLTATGIPQAR